MQRGKGAVFILTQAKQSPSPLHSPARLIGVIDLCLQHKVEGRLPDTAGLAARSNWSATSPLAVTSTLGNLTQFRKSDKISRGRVRYLLFALNLDLRNLAPKIATTKKEWMNSNSYILNNVHLWTPYVENICQPCGRFSVNDSALPLKQFLCRSDDLSAKCWVYRPHDDIYRTPKRSSALFRLMTSSLWVLSLAHAGPRPPRAGIHWEEVEITS